MRVEWLSKTYVEWLNLWALANRCEELQRELQVEQFAHSSNSRSEVRTRTHDIRDQLTKALRLVDEITFAPTGSGTDQPVTEHYIQKLLAFRRKRDRFFEANLFADPAWDILLELYAAELGQRRVSVGSLALGAAVPATTTMRWIRVLEKKGMVLRIDDPLDGRRVFVTLAPNAVDAMDRFFAGVPPQAILL